MRDDLIFYTNPMSRGRIVRWMLEELGEPYETVVLDYGGSMKAPAFLSLNPMGKVPAIVHRDVVVTETAAICAYLADAFPDAGLAPAPASLARASYYRWMFFAAGPLEAALVNVSLGVEVPPERERMVGYGNLELVLDTLEGALDGRDYLAGNRFSAADIYVGSQIRWGMAFGTIAERPLFRAYSDRLAERPAMARATGIDDALMPETGGRTE